MYLISLRGNVRVHDVNDVRKSAELSRLSQEDNEGDLREIFERPKMMLKGFAVLY